MHEMHKGVGLASSRIARFDHDENDISPLGDCCPTAEAKRHARRWTPGMNIPRELVSRWAAPSDLVTLKLSQRVSVFAMPSASVIPKYYARQRLG